MIEKYKNKIEQYKGIMIQLENSRKGYENKTETIQKELHYTEKAQIIIQKVAQETQEQIQFHISNLVTLALEAVFPDPYKFNISFVIKRGKTECELKLEKNGELYDPIDEDGGGIVDITSFALRIALWSLSRTSNTMILDEPMKFLSKDLLPKAGEMLKQLSERLNLQFIIVTHLKELEEYADKIFTVEKKKGESIING